MWAFFSAPPHLTQQSRSSIGKALRWQAWKALARSANAALPRRGSVWMRKGDVHVGSRGCEHLGIEVGTTCLYVGKFYFGGASQVGYLPGGRGVGWRCSLMPLSLFLDSWVARLWADWGISRSHEYGGIGRGQIGESGSTTRRHSPWDRPWVLGGRGTVDGGVVRLSVQTLKHQTTSWEDDPSILPSWISWEDVASSNPASDFLRALLTVETNPLWGGCQFPIGRVWGILLAFKSPSAALTGPGTRHSAVNDRLG